MTTKQNTCVNFCKIYSWLYDSELIIAFRGTFIKIINVFIIIITIIIFRNENFFVSMKLIFVLGC